MDTALRPLVPPLPSVVRPPLGQVDVAQDFVNGLRAAAPRFAVAAGAGSAVVREAVPPARHRRARCRVVLRTDGGGERDLTFLGPVSRPAGAPDPAFAQLIQQWLGAQPDGDGERGGEWLVADDEAPGGVAVDLTAWRASSPSVATLPTTVMSIVPAALVDAGRPTEAMPAVPVAS